MAFAAQTKFFLNQFKLMSEFLDFENFDMSFEESVNFMFYQITFLR